MGKRTIYLHIGSPKTGTKTIQKFLYLNRKLLEKEGILYPIIEGDLFSPLDSNLAELLLKRNYNVVPHIDKNKLEKGFIDEYFKQIWKKKYLPVINSSDAPNILFSSEVLEATEMEIYDFLVNEGFDVKIILYLRRPAEYISALWAEHVKWSGVKTLKSPIYYFYANQKIPYSKIIFYFYKIGAENIILRPYEKEQWKNNSLIEDFLNCININLTDEYIMPEDRNITPDRDVLELIKLKSDLDLEYNLSLKYNDELCNAREFVKNTQLVEILTDDEIKEITYFYMAAINQISEFVGIKKLFLNEFPDCYQKERTNPDKITISYKELEILHNAIKDKVQECDYIKKQLEEKSHFYVKKEDNFTEIKILFFKLRLKNKN